MKKRGILQHISFLLACTLVVGGINVLPVRAGSSSIVVDQSSYEEELDTSLWNSPNNDVEVEKGALIFANESTDTTSLITRVNARISEYHDKLVEAETTLQFTQLPQGEAFALAFGLSSVEALMGEPGNVELQFVNDDGLDVLVKAYDENGEPTIVATAACGSLNDIFRVKVSITTERVLTLTVNGKQICSEKLPCTGEGRVGFLQTGSCGGKVSDVRVVCYEYDRPENTDVYEDFENEALNTNTLTARMVYATSNFAPSRMLIEEMDGNRVLRFQNSGPSYVGTVYQYSNFEMTFDVVYMQREAKMDEEGNVIIPKNDNFAISFGDEAADYTSYGYETSVDMLVFESGSKVRSLNTEKVGYAEDRGYPFYAPDCNENFTVRVSVIDSMVTVGIKWIDEENFTEIMSYQVSETTPTGYVHIWTTSLAANFAIDNLSIVNKDMDPNLVEVDYHSALVMPAADYIYRPMEYKYADDVKTETVFNLYLLIPIVGVLCVATLGMTVFIKRVRNKKENREDGVYEE